MNMVPPGTHKKLIVFYGENREELLCSEENMLDLLKGASIASGATIVKEIAHGFCGGGGVTAVVILSESSASGHSWPENDGYAEFDIFTCGDHCDPQKGLDFIIETTKPKEIYLLIDVPRTKSNIREEVKEV